MDHSTASLEFDRSGRHLTVYLAGALADDTSPALGELIIERTHPGDEVVWLDLSSVTACSGGGLRMLEDVHRHVSASGGTATVYNPAEAVLEVLDAGGISDVMPVRTGHSAAGSRPPIGE